MFKYSCLRNTKQLSMPHLSNKRGVFEVTTAQRAGYGHSILDYISSAVMTSKLLCRIPRNRY